METENIPSDSASDEEDYGASDDENDVNQILPPIEQMMQWDSDSDVDDQDDDQIQSRNCFERSVANQSPEWTKNDSIYDPNIGEFVESTGPTIPADWRTPSKIFLHLFPHDLIEKIVYETNLNATQKAGGTARTIKQTNVNEFKKFLAINLLMGIKKLPSIRDFWSTKEILRDKYIASVMPRDRFNWILTNFHLNDNASQPKRGTPEYDKLYKVRPLINVLSETFLSSYLPSKHQSIDESMIKFKGRSGFRQYMPLKPIKRGFKTWVRANENGYVSSFEVYTGKPTTSSAEKNLGSRVVKDLTAALAGKHHHVYFDNFFNSIDLLKDLKAQKIYACGTIRKNRKGLPTGLMDDKKMTKGAIDWRLRNDGIAFVKWKDSKAVYLASNFHDPVATNFVRRKMKDGTTTAISCPRMVYDYNKHMGYVDKTDMLKSFYELDRKCRKWWHRIFWYLVDICVLNSYKLYDETCATNERMSLKNFRLDVASGLIGTNIPQSNLRRSGQRAPLQPLPHYKVNVSKENRYKNCDHMPIFVGTYRRCGNCSTKTNDQRTKLICSVCDIPLCLKPERNCFKEFHTKKN